jgi:hypothetical protein
VSDPLYHVTYHANLESIAARGLRASCGIGIQPPAYAAHCAQGVFLTERDGVFFWASKAEEHAQHNSDHPMSDGLAPVVLRVRGVKRKCLVVDELGTRDALADAWISACPIAPERLDVWTGSEWVPIADWEEVDHELAFALEVDPDADPDDPDSGVIEWFAQSSPLTEIP